MSHVQRLLPPALSLPQCSARRVTRYANDTARTDRQCLCRARYRVDGQPLCTKHAGVAALAILLKGAKA